MSDWVSVNDRTPIAKLGKWSKPVIALCDCGLVYRLSYFYSVDGSCWQRTKSFTDNSSKRVTHWQPLNLPE